MSIKTLNANIVKLKATIELVLQKRQAKEETEKRRHYRVFIGSLSP